MVQIDPASLLYVVQQQPLGSIQWSVVASSLKETSYTITSLSKGVRYAFRVLTSTGKTLSKPSPPTDLVQLLDRGKATELLPDYTMSTFDLYTVYCYICYRTIFKESTSHLRQTGHRVCGGEPACEYYHPTEPCARCGHLEEVCQTKISIVVMFL